MPTKDEVDEALRAAKLAVLVSVKSAAEGGRISGTGVAGWALAYRYLEGGQQPVINEQPAK